MTLELTLRSLDDPRLSAELPLLLLWPIVCGVEAMDPSVSSPRKEDAVVPIVIYMIDGALLCFVRFVLDKRGLRLFSNPSTFPVSSSQIFTIHTRLQNNVNQPIR